MKKESKQLIKDRMKEVICRLKLDYPEAKCSLSYSDAHQLLVATILSAQCTDKRVNMVAPKLFKKYNWPSIDVTRKSVEETAASIIKIIEIKKNQ